MKKNQKGFIAILFIIIGVVLIMGIVGVIYFYLQTRQAVDDVRSNTYQNQPQTATSVKTYSDANFSIQYPADLLVEVGTEDKNSQTIDFKVPNRLNNLLGVIIYKKNTTTVQEKIDRWISAPGYEVKVNDLTIAGIKGKRADFKVSGINMSYIYFESPHGLYGIRSVGMSESQFADFYKSLELN